MSDFSGIPDSVQISQNGYGRERGATTLLVSDDGTVVAELIARPSLLNQVLEAQKKDEKITATINQIVNGKETEFIVNEKGVLYYKDRVCVPDCNDLRKSILEEAHSGSFAIHPGNIKMYRDLKMSFWWSRMKRDVSEFVTKCLVCQSIKAEHQVPSGLLGLSEYWSGNGTESPWILWLGYH